MSWDARSGCKVLRVPCSPVLAIRSRRKLRHRSKPIASEIRLCVYCGRRPLIQPRVDSQNSSRGCGLGHGMVKSKNTSRKQSEILGDRARNAYVNLFLSFSLSFKLKSHLCQAPLQSPRRCYLLVNVSQNCLQRRVEAFERFFVDGFLAVQCKQRPTCKRMRF